MGQTGASGGDEKDSGGGTLAPGAPSSHPPELCWGPGFPPAVRHHSSPGPRGPGAGQQTSLSQTSFQAEAGGWASWKRTEGGGDGDGEGGTPLQPSVCLSSGAEGGRALGALGRAGEARPLHAEPKAHLFPLPEPHGFP